MMNTIAFYFLIFFIVAVISFFLSMNFFVGVTLIGIVYTIYFLLRDLVHDIGLRENVWVSWLWNPVVAVIVAGVTIGSLLAFILALLGGRSNAK